MNYFWSCYAVYRLSKPEYTDPVLLRLKHSYHSLGHLPPPSHLPATLTSTILNNPIASNLTQTILLESFLRPQWSRSVTLIL